MFFNFFLRNTLAYSSIDLKFTDKQHHVHFFNTPFKIRNSDWDQSKERPKNIYAKTHKKLNAKLDRIKIAIAEYAREKEREKEKISKMLDRLTLSVKLENEDFAITKSAFDLKVLCDEVASNLETKYKDRKILLNVESITLFSDKTMLELALVNLVENALKYSSSDIFIELKDNMILVKDSGIGIKEEELKNITKKFYRVDKNSWNNSMGLGLAMVSYTLKLLGSSLEIESKFGQGSTFSFSIEPMLKS